MSRKEREKRVKCKGGYGEMIEWSFDQVDGRRSTNAPTHQRPSYSPPPSPIFFFSNRVGVLG